jgi:hypothetical protein
MIPIHWTVLWAALAALVAAAGIVALFRRRRHLAARAVVDDDAVQRILDVGSLDVEDDEPLDIAAIDVEEERFWAERWDDADDEWTAR